MTDLRYNFYYYFYKFCLKVGLIQMRLHTEVHEDDDMIVCVVEPTWFWKKGNSDE